MNLAYGLILTGGFILALFEAYECYKVVPLKQDTSRKLKLIQLAFFTVLAIGCFCFAVCSICDLWTD